MTIGEVLEDVDELKPNTYDDNIKVRWLSELDGKIFREVILTHKHDEDASFDGYTTDDMDEDLLVNEPYADLYRSYLSAMIDYSNGETDRYQMSLSMFQSNYHDFVANYNKTVMPIANQLQLF